MIEAAQDVAKMRRALENCRMLAVRQARRAKRAGNDPSAWEHVVRFCGDAGVVGSILRTPEPATSSSMADEHGDRFFAGDYGDSGEGDEP